MKKYDYLVVGAGPFGSIFAYEASKRGKRVKVIDKRDHVGGNMYCENIEGINVHKYGAHIFHTSNQRVWDYLNQFASFNRYTNSPIAIYNDAVYNLPFNMNTFNKLWGVVTPQQAKNKIEEQRAKHYVENPSNLEEQALNLVGTDIYETLIKSYTEKQWGRKCVNLPSFIIKRLPVRFTYDNNYFNDTYQGIPIGGYNVLFEKWLENVDVCLNVDYFDDRLAMNAEADKVVFTGMIDQYYQYQFGRLEYRSLEFKHEVMDSNNFQGNAVVNYTGSDVPYTRIIEHKHFEFGQQEKTVITKEYSREWYFGDEPYYPINNDDNAKMYEQYAALASKETNVIFGGRLAEYKYYDMHHIVENALQLVENELNEK